MLSSGVLIAGSASNATSKRDFAVSTTANPDPVSSLGKIALEEHFDFSETANSSYASFGGQEFQRQIKDLGSGRTAEMSIARAFSNLAKERQISHLWSQQPVSGLTRAISCALVQPSSEVAYASIP